MAKGAQRVIQPATDVTKRDTFSTVVDQKRSKKLSCMIRMKNQNFNRYAARSNASGSWTKSKPQSVFTTSTVKGENRSTSTHGSKEKDTLKRDTNNNIGYNQKCVVCSKAGHQIWECRMLKAKPWKERHEIIKGEKLCYNCLNADKKLDHSLVSKCPLPKECKVKDCRASRKHHPLLHFDEKPCETLENMCTHAEGAQDQKVYFPAFPVVVKSPVSGKEVRTWAGIDSYSSACFMEKSLLFDLAIEPADENISLNTLHWTQSGLSTVVELDISSADGTEEPIRLNEVYSWEKLPMGNRHIPSKEVWKRYSHLSGLQISATPTDRVKILIGSNVPEVHQQLEWRPGESRGDPVAVRYKWGWTLLGGIPHGKLDCNFVSLEKNLSEKLMQLAEFEYAGTKCEFEKPISADDLKVRKILEDGTYRCDRHYYVPIPLIETSDTMPNNRELARKRLMSLKSKLSKGKTVAPTSQKTELEAYQELFADYRNKGYIRRIPKDEIKTEDVVNYVPFHHVYHEAKPGKLRLVWDAAAKYENSCLNDHIYSGEDQINSLLAVLLRFRMGGEIAFQADINCMFNQVFVPRENWNLLRFLWFVDDDINGDVEVICLANISA
ncbi:uncharacterized protein LOC135492611 [Lineus longissimus]|uniref:uncharacterized protein LOC135492611 n=1 Tax=Lineus longissimus TaxID=88925 RepID=UPI00315CDD0F